MKAYAAIIAHCLETLPDSITKRRSVLVAIHELLADSHEQKPFIARMIADLDEQDRFQLRLANLFRNEVVEYPHEATRK